MSIAKPRSLFFPKLRGSGTSKKYAAPTELERSRTTRDYRHVAHRELHPRGNRAFNILELLVVIATLVILAGFMFPVIFKHKSAAVRVVCRNNLLQVGLAFRLWHDDHNDHYPMQFFTNELGVMKFADVTNFYVYFQVMSNELSSPRIVVCPNDLKRSAAVDFIQFTNKNISYFIGLDADEKFPGRILCGDRNLTNGVAPRNGVLEMTTNQPVGWSTETHQGFGNIAFVDGSVRELSQADLNAALAASGLATNRLAVP
jgi:prepilin-type processing-associated H-X9-DG protein